MKLIIIKFQHEPEKFCEDVCSMAEKLAYDITAVVSLEEKITTPSINDHSVVPLNQICNLQWDAAVLACGGNFFNDFPAPLHFVSNITERNVTRIDDTLPNLRGAEKLLTNNHVRASVCIYHNADDLVRVKSILQRYGYKTSTSDGYMVFLLDSDIWNTADFRKGIVRAKNF